jgi:hypothetical protein
MIKIYDAFQFKGLSCYFGNLVDKVERRLQFQGLICGITLFKNFVGVDVLVLLSCQVFVWLILRLESK